MRAGRWEGPSHGRGRLLTCVVASLACLTFRIEAQAVSRGPVFLLQPGFVTTDFMSSQSDASSTGFNARFATLLRTGRSWLTPIAGANVTPYGTTGFTTSHVNAPSVFAGNVFPLVPDSALGGWIQLDVSVLWYYTYDGGGRHASRLYGRDLYVELAITAPLGRKLLEGLGPNWRRLDGYLLFDQNLTPNPDPVSTRTDRFNPIALFGMTFRIGQVP